MGARWHARGCLVLFPDWLSLNLQRSLLSFTIRALSGSTLTCLRSWERSTTHVLPGYIYKDHALECHSRYPYDLGIRSVTFNLTCLRIIYKRVICPEVYLAQPFIAKLLQGCSTAESRSLSRWETQAMFNALDQCVHYTAWNAWILFHITTCSVYISQ